MRLSKYCFGAIRRRVGIADVIPDSARQLGLHIEQRVIAEQSVRVHCLQCCHGLGIDRINRVAGVAVEDQRAFKLRLQRPNYFPRAS